MKLRPTRNDSDLCQSEFCQSLPNHTHVNKETSYSCIDNLLSPRSSKDLVNRETQFKNVHRKVYRNVREANHRSLSYRNKYKLAKPLRVGQKVLLQNHNVTFGKSQKLCELRSGPYIVTEVITNVYHEIALDADQAGTQVVHGNHLVEYFPRDNELLKLLSDYENPFNDDKTEHFYNENAKKRPSELNQPINSFLEQQHLNDYLPIFPDTCGPSRMDTIFKSPVKDKNCLLTPNLSASSPDSGIQQPSPNTPLSFQSESSVITSHPTSHCLLPRTSGIDLKNFQSTSTGKTPRSKTQEFYEVSLASGKESHLSKLSPF